MGEFVSSQMTPAVYSIKTVLIDANNYQFKAVKSELISKGHTDCLLLKSKETAPKVNLPDTRRRHSAIQRTYCRTTFTQPLRDTPMLQLLTFLKKMALVAPPHMPQLFRLFLTVTMWYEKRAK